MTKQQILELFPLGNPFPLDGDRRRYDPVTAAVGIGGGLVSGLLGSSASKRAAEVQSRAATDASDRVGVATGQADTGLADAIKAGQEVVTAGGQRVIDTAGAGAAGATAAAGQANSLLDPYAAAGSTASGVLNAGIAEGGAFNHAPTLAELQMDPGYAFRLQQGQLAMERSAAARGGALGGGAAKDLAGYSQGMASQEYQNAFNRFETSTQNRFQNVMGVSKAGQDAAGRQGANLTDAAQYGGTLQTGAATTALGANEFGANLGMTGAGEIGTNLMNGAKTQGDFLTGGANAKAAGIVGSANAWSQGIGAGVNGVTNGAYMNLLKNPALAVQGAPAGTGGGIPGGVPIYTGAGGIAPPGPSVPSYPRRV